jgi:hypothetical protein
MRQLLEVGFGGMSAQGVRGTSDRFGAPPADRPDQQLRPDRADSGRSPDDDRSAQVDSNQPLHEKGAFARASYSGTLAERDY